MRPLKELIEAAKRDPSSLSPAELKHLRAELRRRGLGKGGAYDATKERARERQATLSRSGRDLGNLPPPKQPARRDACEFNLELFLLTYFTHLFYLPFGDDHRKVIKQIERAVLEGGLFAYAMPRGSGKTVIAECAAIWAIIYGHRGFVVILGSTAAAAEESLASIKTEFESNELLGDDFPESCLPVRALEGIVQRSRGQHLGGKRTHIEWKGRRIVLPTIAGSKASGAVLQVAGLTGRIRGMKFKRPDGVVVRPDFVMPDDPQTRESAESVTQCAKRERILAGDVLGLAGPGKQISGLMPCTVIRAGDMADRILDREKHPAWNGERLKAMYQFPTHQAHWERYGELWADGQRRGEGTAAATAYYEANRAEMDVGAVVGWKDRFDRTERSAVQHCMNVKLRDEPAFWAEYQNEPKPLVEVDVELLNADLVAKKFNRMARRIVPLSATHLTAFIDVHGEIFYWLVLATGNDFTGWVVDYGVYPEQSRRYFTKREAKPTIRDKAPSAGLEGAIYAALEATTGEILGREWKREGGATARVERCLIDANWGKATKTVYLFCRQSAYAPILLPSHGRYVGATSTPMSAYQDRAGEQSGDNWRIIAGVKRSVRHVIYDTNSYKSFVKQRLELAMGDRSNYSLFGDNAESHRLFADHMTAERGVEVEAKGRKVTEWTQLLNRDNDWFDCLVGASVAAAIQGASLFTTTAKPTVTLSKLERRRHGRS